jgi:hypothetical protein
MITPTRRDLVVAALTASVCLGLFGFVGQDRLAASVPAPKPIMGSMAFDWEKLVVKPTKIGAYRKVCQAPTATLDELEYHITTLNPGQAPTFVGLTTNFSQSKAMEPMTGLAAGTSAASGPGTMKPRRPRQTEAVRAATTRSRRVGVIMRP